MDQAKADKLAKVVAQVVRSRRKRYKLSPAKLAARAGVTRQAIDKLERGGGRPSFALVVALAEALHFDLEWEVLSKIRKGRREWVPW